MRSGGEGQGATFVSILGMGRSPQPRTRREYTLSRKGLQAGECHAAGLRRVGDDERHAQNVTIIIRDSAQKSFCASVSEALESIEQRRQR